MIRLLPVSRNNPVAKYRTETNSERTTARRHREKFNKSLASAAGNDANSIRPSIWISSGQAAANARVGKRREQFQFFFLVRFKNRPNPRGNPVFRKRGRIFFFFQKIVRVFRLFLSLDKHSRRRSGFPSTRFHHSCFSVALENNLAAATFGVVINQKRGLHFRRRRHRPRAICRFSPSRGIIIYIYIVRKTRTESELSSQFVQCISYMIIYNTGEGRPRELWALKWWLSSCEDDGGVYVGNIISLGRVPHAHTREWIISNDADLSRPCGSHIILASNFAHYTNYWTVITGLPSGSRRASSFAISEWRRGRGGRPELWTVRVVEKNLSTVNEWQGRGGKYSLLNNVARRIPTFLLVQCIVEYKNIIFKSSILNVLLSVA